MRAIGLFGKLPSAGDFVSRGFSTELVDSLDGMVAAAIAAACEQGATRQLLERTAPGLVIHIRPGALCRPGFIGSITPSSDRVGRFYPLCLGMETDPAPKDPTLRWISIALAGRLVRLAYEAHTESMSPDQVQAGVPEPEHFWRLAFADHPFRSALDATMPPMPSETAQYAFEGPESLMTEADRALCLRLESTALAVGAVVTRASAYDLYFVTGGQPGGAQMAALFDGRWQHWGWTLRSRQSEGDDDTRPPVRLHRSASIRSDNAED